MVELSKIGEKVMEGIKFRPEHKELDTTLEMLAEAFRKHYENIILKAIKEAQSNDASRK